LHLPVAVNENEVTQKQTPHFSVISNQSQSKMHPRCHPRNAAQRSLHKQYHQPPACSSRSTCHTTNLPQLRTSCASSCQAGKSTSILLAAHINTKSHLLSHDKSTLLHFSQERHSELLTRGSSPLYV